MLSARRALSDAEKTQADTIAERKTVEDRLKVAEARVHDLEAKLEEEGRESSDLEVLRQRLAEGMEDERKQHQQDLAERDFAADQTRKKYQSKDRLISFLRGLIYIVLAAELAQLSEGGLRAIVEVISY